MNSIVVQVGAGQAEKRTDAISDSTADVVLNLDPAYRAVLSGEPAAVNLSPMKSGAVAHSSHQTPPGQKCGHRCGNSER